MTVQFCCQLAMDGCCVPPLCIWLCSSCSSAFQDRSSLVLQQCFHMLRMMLGSTLYVFMQSCCCQYEADGFPSLRSI